MTNPCAKLLALPLLSLIFASASSLLIVGLRVSFGSAETLGGVMSMGAARGMRVVVEIVWKVWDCVSFWAGRTWWIGMARACEGARVGTERVRVCSRRGLWWMTVSSEESEAVL